MQNKKYSNPNSNNFQHQLHANWVLKHRQRLDEQKRQQRKRHFETDTEPMDIEPPQKKL